MNDKELLELAAKAARLPECGWMGPVFVYVKDNTFTEWNPLRDDGDAFRLAVMLQLETYIGPRGVAVRTHCGLKTLEDGHDGASVRQAIVRAAAEIGQAMS